MMDLDEVASVLERDQGRLLVEDRGLVFEDINWFRNEWSTYLQLCAEFDDYPMPEDWVNIKRDDWEWFKECAAEAQLDTQIMAGSAVYFRVKLTRRGQ